MDSSRWNIVLACVLSALAGYVDGIGFLHLGGLFVSFMSGNTTRLGVSVAMGQWSAAGEALTLIALFVTGAGIGSLIVLRLKRYHQAVLLLVETALLGGGAALYGFGHSQPAVAAIVLAMGLENAVFQIEGGGGLGLTYVTGALVKVGQLIAAALAGGARWAWLPNLLLWASLATGGVIGATAYRSFNLSAIWFAATVTALLGVFLALAARRRAA